MTRDGKGLLLQASPTASYTLGHPLGFFRVSVEIIVYLPTSSQSSISSSLTGTLFFLNQAPEDLSP